MIEFDPVLVHEWLTRSARRFPQKDALIFGEQRWTYAALEQKASQLGQGLINLGIKRQDRVIVLLNNSPEAVISIYGILKSGAVFAVLDSTLKGEKLRYIIENAQAHTLITHISKARVLNEALKGHQEKMNIIWVGPKKDITCDFPSENIFWESLIAEDNKSTPQANDSIFPQSLDVDLACLIYTSGSTGRPKGVMSTHNNMISAARSIIQYLDNSPDDRILSVLPLSFSYGLYQVIMAFMFGGTVILEPSFLYLHQVLGRVRQEKVTGFPFVPTIIAMLRQLKDIQSYDLGSLRYMTNAGAAMPEEHIRWLREMFPQVSFYSMYGLTECIRVLYLLPEDVDKRPTSVGRAMPNCEVKIVDEQGNEVPAGQSGELIVRGANVMQGYWNNDNQTSPFYRTNQYLPDRFIHTGDYFKKDEEGFLYFLGRKDDIIKSKGERISAKEVENTICSLGQVAEAAVIGVADDILGQAIKAFVVPAPGAQLSTNDVLKVCQHNLEAFAVPKFIDFMETLPKTPNGKIDKQLLKNTPPA